MPDPRSVRGAYLATTYLAESPDGERFPLRVGRRHPGLDARLRELGVRAWAFITACNPRSEPLPGAENAARMVRLREAVAGLGFAAWEGQGIGDDGDWPPEPSLLILGITRARAAEFAREFGQNAFVYGELDQPAILVWTAPEA